MSFIDRASQTANRPWDAFSPFTRLSDRQVGLLSLGKASPLSDELLDGIAITRRDVAAHWLTEGHVHRAVALSHRVENTRSFLGAQVIATRDDIRQLSHFIVAEPDRLVLITTNLGEVSTKRILHHGQTRRAHLCLDNYSGTPNCLYVVQKDAATYALHLNDTELTTASSTIDFPFMALAQSPKGHVPMALPAYGLLSYKCRATGKLYVRSIDATAGVGPERELAAPTCIGGLDFAIHNDDVLLHIDAIVDGRLVPMVASSSDRGNTFVDFAPIDLAGFVPDSIVPAASPIARDYHGNFHVPIAALKDGQQHLLDVHGGDVVETMVLDGRGYGYNLLVFPKASAQSDPLGRGDGVTDGIGIIATTIIEGKLMISNSQAGGFHYPKERCVNHEMTKMFSFRATECCYTRAQSANMVSMDYVFIEANDDGDPLSNTLWLETWDMPLPNPVLSAVASQDSVTVRIERDAWFETGKTTFTFSDPRIKILAVNFVSRREVNITCDTTDLVGKTVSFDMKNFLYWHSGHTTIVAGGTDEKA